MSHTYCKKGCFTKHFSDLFVKFIPVFVYDEHRESIEVPFHLYYSPYIAMIINISS